MQKLMFNDNYGLTQAVIKLRKTMTRRIIPLTDTDKTYLDTAFDWDLRERVIIDRYAKYKVGEVVAVAQCYEDAILDVGEEKWNKIHKWYNINYLCHEKGLHNKMFVRADLMPHQIQITDVKIERLQEISEEDCLKEGVVYDSRHWVNGYKVENLWNKIDRQSHFRSAQVAFANLINRISGKGTWLSNPYVFAYSFKLIK